MATVTRVVLSCDVCGNAEGVATRKFGLDGTTYEIDLCPNDSDGLSKAAAEFVPKARKGTTSKRPPGGRKPRSRAGRAATGERGSTSGRKTPRQGRVTGSPPQAKNTSRPNPRSAKASGPKPRAAGSGERKASRARPRDTQAAASQRTAKATGVPQGQGIYVYGILPADIEVADQTPGVGEPAGPLRAVRCNGLAALISEVGQATRLGSPADHRTHKRILDATAAEVPVLPLRFGTVMASEEAVAQELLAAHHDEFAAALEQLEGRAEFLVTGRYLQQAAGDEDRVNNAPDTARRKNPDTAGDATGEPGQLRNEAVTATRKQDTRALQRAMERVCVASVLHQPAHNRDAVHAAFLVPVDQQSEVEQVIEDLAREWEGRIDLQLLGPMAAYDFVGTATPHD